jgi:hypothetical protein
LAPRQHVGLGQRQPEQVERRRLAQAVVALVRAPPLGQRAGRGDVEVVPLARGAEPATYRERVVAGLLADLAQDGVVRALAVADRPAGDLDAGGRVGLGEDEQAAVADDVRERLAGQGVAEADGEADPDGAADADAEGAAEADGVADAAASDGFADGSVWTRSYASRPLSNVCGDVSRGPFRNDAR